MASPIPLLTARYDPDGLKSLARRGHQAEQAAQAKPGHPQRQQEREQYCLDHHCAAHEGFHRRTSLSSQKEEARDQPIGRALKMKCLRQ
jgi:hypothetical protein